MVRSMDDPPQRESKTQGVRGGSCRTAVKGFTIRSKPAAHADDGEQVRLDPRDDVRRRLDPLPEVAPTRVAHGRRQAVTGRRPWRWLRALRRHDDHLQFRVLWYHFDSYIGGSLTVFMTEYHSAISCINPVRPA